MKIKLLAISLLIVTVFVSCKNDNQEEGLVHKWHLIEQLADPGDGSGTFQPVDSNKTLSFYEDGTVVSNGSLCAMTTAVGNGSSATYSFQDSTITVADCGSQPPYPMTFEMEGGYLILKYPCIEPCREKYEQVQ